jgi:hypothetical protein
MISLLCPTRSRVKQAEILLKSFKETQTNQNQLLFYIQSDDPFKEQYENMFKEHGHTDYIVEPWQPTSYLWNRLSDIAKGDLLGLMGDDVVIETKGWDLIIEENAKRYPDGIFMISMLDGRKEPEIGKNIGAPHPIMHRKWKETLGFFLPPQFMHRYLDTYSKKLAQSLGRYIQLRNVRFDHQKEKYNKDETGRISREWITYDKYSYEKTKRYFEFDLETLRKEMKE